MQLGARVRAFASFARRRSFAGAAEELRVSQPAISQHIADLERDLGAKLVERRSRRLTEAGELLAKHVLRAEALLVKGGDCVRAQRRTEPGNLSIVASGTPGTYLLPEVIANFQNLYPGGGVNFRIDTAKNAVNSIRSHTAEIGVVGAFMTAPEIEVEPLIEDEIIIIGAPKLKRKKRLSRDEAEALTWITREEGSGTSALAESVIGDLGITPNNRFALPSWEAIKIAVRLGHGIAALSRLAVSEELKSGSLVCLPLFPNRIRRIFSIIRIRDAALTPAAERFLMMLREHCTRKTS
jgi:LysR family transcriptional regulator, transcriptional activator of the cysJI operon